MKFFFTTSLAILGALSLATTSVEAQLLTTPGLIVPSPFQNMGVYQGGYMSISFRFQNGKPVGGSTVTMAKKDGSGNTTLHTIPDTENLDRFLISYPIPATLEVGDYRVSIITKPGTGTPKTGGSPGTNAPRSSSSSAAATPTAAGLAWENDGFVVLAPSPTGTGDASTPSGAPGAPSVYYYAADVQVKPAKDKPETPKSPATTLSQSAGQIAWKAAAALGCVALVAVTL
ncbi:hypothetical protein BGZ73_004624 [Actinomortierella ambigua]|nr:hypothetical protein BGZ73_004624 [Actinomortierella ambigua]